jgi:hypothetical protein
LPVLLSGGFYPLIFPLLLVFYRFIFYSLSIFKLHRVESAPLFPPVSPEAAFSLSSACAVSAPLSTFPQALRLLLLIISILSS